MAQEHNDRGPRGHGEAGCVPALHATYAASVCWLRLRSTKGGAELSQGESACVVDNWQGDADAR